MILRLMIFSSWLSLTCFVNFVAVPTVFRNVSKLHEAGQVGMKVFSTFNALELFFSLFSIVLCLILLKKNKLRFPKVQFVLQLFLVVLLSVYNFHLTPKIKQIGIERHQQQEVGEVERVEELEKQHSFYHGLYVKLDSGKILVILGLIILGFQAPKKIGREP